MGKVVEQMAAVRQSVSIVDYALGIGWTVDPMKSSATVTVLRRDTEKLIATFGRKGWIYRDERTHDQGDLVDFMRREHGWTFREAVAALSAQPERRERPPSFPSGSISLAAARKKAAAVWESARFAPRNPYLLGRGISERTLRDPRFHDRQRLTANGATLFPHDDHQGLCGYEVRGNGLKAFGKNTRKGLWTSTNIDTAPQVLIVESVIDGLSHAELYRDESGYISLAGEIGTRQRQILVELLVRLHERHARVVVATDHDAAGHATAQRINEFSDKPIDRLMPISKDWSEDLAFVIRENL